jgi:hypothetical protein
MLKQLTDMGYAANNKAAVITVARLVNCFGKIDAESLIIEKFDANNVIFKNGFNKKGEENIYPSSGTNKSISNFREIIPNHQNDKMHC